MLVDSLILYVPIVVALISFILLIRKLKNKREIYFESTIFLISLYSILIGAYFNNFSSNLSKFESNHEQKINELKTILNIYDSSVETVPNTNEKDILERLTTQIEYWPKDKLRFERFLVSPSEDPGQLPNYDVLYGGLFFSYGFQLSYFLGFPWDQNSQSNIEKLNNQRQMSLYMLKLLLYGKWREFQHDNLLHNKKLIFHIPRTNTYDYWSISIDNKCISGVSFLDGRWSGSNTFPKRNLVLFMNNYSIAVRFQESFIDLLNEGINHIKNELNKSIFDRCVCTLFVGKNPEDGLVPMTSEEFKEKVKFLEARFYSENGASINKPFLLNEICILLDKMDKSK